jgi:outer membrane lipoprotein SlyB
MAEEYKVKLKFVPDTASLKNSLGNLGNVGIGGFGKGAGGFATLSKSILRVVGFLSLLMPIFRVLSLILRPIKDILYVALLPMLYLFRPIGIFFQTVLRPYLQRALVAQRLGLQAQAEGETGIATGMFLESARIVSLGFVDLIVQSLAGFSGIVLRAFGFEELATAIELSAANFSQNLLTSIDNSLNTTIKDLVKSGLLDEKTGLLLVGIVASLQGGIEESDLSPIQNAISDKMVKLVDGVLSELTDDKNIKNIKTSAAATGTGIVGGAIAGGALGFSVGGPLGAIGGGLLGAILGGKIGDMVGDFINLLEHQDESVAKSALQFVGSYLKIGDSITTTGSKMKNLVEKFDSMDNKSINWTINIRKRYVSSRVRGSA